MLMILSSLDAVAPNGVPKMDLVEALKTIKSRHNPVAIISNHPEPVWFKTVFGGSNVQFLQEIGRQSGRIIPLNAEKFNLHPYDALILASNRTDIHMGKNGGGIICAAGWSDDQQLQNWGLRVNSAAEFFQVIELTSAWNGHWWFTANAPNYRIKALADLSGYGKEMTQQIFGTKVTNTVKNGGAQLNALLTVSARSLLIDGIADESNLVWGVYPSSSSKNDDNEVLSDFTHRLRTTVSRVRYAKRGDPLFIRHKPSPKRSKGGGGDRTNPADQIETIHLNPIYKTSVINKHVFVVDDCATYGVSFGVAAALLHKAGAALVTGVALGKFGNQLNSYAIEIYSDPYAPIASGNYVVTDYKYMAGSTSNEAQSTLRNIIP